MLRRIPLILLVFVGISSLSPANAADLDIVGPPGSGAFGTHVVVLPNGNIVVTDPSGPVSNIGAVYLYSPNGTQISALTGSSSGDRVGEGGIVVLPNGNFLVGSRSWRNTATNAAAAGAVTWVNGATGLSGVVSAANSLVGTSANDEVGMTKRNGADVIALANGNYVVTAKNWDNGSVPDAGAVIWGNGSAGISGPVSTSNSLHGTQQDDQVGYGYAIALDNGNYVVSSFASRNGTASASGAVTWGNGTTGLVGPISAANSLIGLNGSTGSGHAVVRLSNDNYVVASYFWDSGLVASAGAVTWASGSVGLTGMVSAANSLVGSSIRDDVGLGGIFALRNGNYVVSSPNWNNGPTADVGATTWGNGSVGTTGSISASNSLIGTSAGDGTSPPGASTANVVALTNGNYVVINNAWENGAIADVGAVTWGDGTIGRSGVISPSNSLIGSSANDLVGSAGVTALANGNYVVSSKNWRNGASANAGAGTWANGTSGLVGVVSSSNSLVGTSPDDQVGISVTALTNGNYMVVSSFWNNGSASQAGAVTWANGTSGRTGVVSPGNSLVGGTNGDGYGGWSLVLANGHFVTSSSFWDNGATTDAGAFTWINGNTGLVASVSSANSIVGTTASDNVGLVLRNLSSGSYAVINPNWDNGGIVNAGAVTIARSYAPISGFITPANSVRGTKTGRGSGLNVAYDPVLDRAVVGRPGDNIVTARALSLFADGFE